jgi:hypothetical protein
MDSFTKAQEAQIAKVRSLIDVLENLRYNEDRMETLKEIENILLRYFGVKPGSPIPKKTVEGLVMAVYNALMSRNFYDDATKFAEKWEL